MSFGVETRDSLFIMAQFHIQYDNNISEILLKIWTTKDEEWNVVVLWKYYLLPCDVYYNSTKWFHVGILLVPWCLSMREK